MTLRDIRPPCLPSIVTLSYSTSSKNQAGQRLDFLPAPSFQINHNRRPPASRDDPDDVLVTLVHFPMFSPRGDESEVTGGERLFLFCDAELTFFCAKGEGEV
jgi:hypothetical protein